MSSLTKHLNNYCRENIAIKLSFIIANNTYSKSASMFFSYN